MKTRLSKMLTSIMLIICVLMSVLCSSCDIGSKHLEKHYDENDNDNIHGWDDEDDSNVISWDNAPIQTYDDVDIFSEWAYSTVLFDGISEDYPVVDAVVLDYRDNGQYFDGEMVYELVNDEFDVNSFVSKYAVGTGVIVVCVILHVATYGSSSAIACFFAGAADASVSYAIKGQALSTCIGAVTSAIKTKGDWEATMYGSLEAGADGYMWGAIWGAATGGFNSQYCFTADTLIQTENGLKPICDIKPGDIVLSYNEEFGIFEYQKVEFISTNETNSTIKVETNLDCYESTQGHPYLTNRGWVDADCLCAGDKLLSKNGWTEIKDVIRIDYETPILTYNFSVNNTHTYLIGEENVVVHNKCNARDETRYFKEGTPQAEKYPEGVYFDKNGYPRFERYIVNGGNVTFEPGKLTGVYNTDAALANKAMGWSETPPGCVWHHVEDGRTLILLPQDLHSVRFGGMAHNGGSSIIKNTIASGSTIIAGASI